METDAKIQPGNTIGERVPNSFPILVGQSRLSQTFHGRRGLGAAPAPPFGDAGLHRRSRAPFFWGGDRQLKNHPPTACPPQRLHLTSKPRPPVHSPPPQPCT